MRQNKPCLAPIMTVRLSSVGTLSKARKLTEVLIRLKTFFSFPPAKQNKKPKKWSNETISAKKCFL